MKNLWFGYIYYPSGDPQVKRFFDMEDIYEVKRCIGDTVYYCVDSPFEASDRDEAFEVLKQQYLKDNPPKTPEPVTDILAELGLDKPLVP